MTIGEIFDIIEEDRKGWKMKKSEFINKTKEELQAALEELLSYEFFEDDEKIKLVKLLLSNDAVLKMTAKEKDGRAQLCVLAETIKGLSGMLKMAEKAEQERMATEGVSEEELMSVVIESNLNGMKKAAELEEMLEEDDDIEISDQDVLKAIKTEIKQAYDFDDEELDEIIQTSFEKAKNDESLEGFDYLGDDDISLN